MSEVVEFKRPAAPEPSEPAEPLVWVCLCGCTTWYARADGVIECAHCSNVSTDGPSGWRATLPTDQHGEVEDTFKIAGGEHVEFWLKKYARPGIRAAIIIDASGKPVTWVGHMSDEDRAALRTALERL